jgi:hypothetical protein
MATYAISMGCVLWRRIKLPHTLPPTKWSLGKWGVAVNGIGITYIVFSFFWAFWSIYWNPTAEEVNNNYRYWQMTITHADVCSADELCGRAVFGYYVAVCCQLLCQPSSRVH